MQYQKPEIVLVGHATKLILGIKVNKLEPRLPLRPLNVIDSELDD